MNLHRVFVAIHLPENVKEELLAYKDMWAELPAKWTTRENLHITLAFLGNRSDRELENTTELIQKVGERHKPFSLNIDRISYGPHSTSLGQANLDNPRMIWALLEESQEIRNLQQDIVKTLSLESNVSFLPHLTLAKLSAFQLRQMELEELPQIDEEVSLSFQVNSIVTMESKLKRSGSHYTILTSVSL
jgi:RNA 2',3'-cyclic 3'-phosphodiesterase